MAEEKGKSGKGCLVLVVVLALVGAALVWFWEDLENAVRKGDPAFIKDAVNANRVRQKPR